MHSFTSDSYSIAAESKNHALFHKTVKLPHKIVLLMTSIFDIVHAIANFTFGDFYGHFNAEY